MHREETSREICSWCDQWSSHILPLARGLERVCVLLVRCGEFASRVGVFVHGLLLGKRFMNSAPFVLENQGNSRVRRKEVLWKIFVLFVDFWSDFLIQA